ncbi:MAG: pyridoxal-dependent decarboxylase [Balneolaceae bacterium]|nr:pyridoxal-dependent decarboxylase [Balneolaceae bacterium]
MDAQQFRDEAHKLVDWMADYIEHAEDYPVKPDLSPGEIKNRLPAEPPDEGEPFETILEDFREIIVPGMTHWQSPKFMAYFPANSSYPSVLAEMLTATLGAQCMNWITSPAATELEERVMEWLREMIGLPPTFTGVIQDTASTATLCALLMARERASDFVINESGFPSDRKFTVYGSTETHSSIEKDVKIAGFGREALRKVPVDPQFAMKPQALEEAVQRDLRRGLTPACVVATVGTTGSTAIDPVGEIAEICKRYELFLHIDAAYAGTALLLPEYRWMNEGVEEADSFVFNPHKWMFTNFDCSAFYVRDPELLVRTFEIHPEYLKSSEDRRVKNYRDWGIQLGRRFRALKLWFVIREFGVEGIREKLRNHLHLAELLERKIADHPDFELMAPVVLNLVCFRYHPAHVDDEEKLNSINEVLLDRIQESGELFITHTTLEDKFTLRMVIGQTRVQQRHLEEAWEAIQRNAESIMM